MRVIVPYNEVHPLTRAALEEHAAGYEVEYHDTSASDTAYAELMSRIFHDGEAFCVIEADNVIDATVLPRFENCGCDYAAVPYEWTTNVAPALGCTYFGQKLLDEVPLPNLSRFHFRQVDIAIVRTHYGQKHRRQPHVHLPPIVHANPLQALRPEFEHLTLAEHLAALGYEIADDGLTADYTHPTFEFGELPA